MAAGREEVRRRGARANWVLGGWRGTQEAGRGWLGRLDRRRRELVVVRYDGCRDGGGAGADLGREDLLEALSSGDVFDILEILESFGFILAKLRSR